MIAAAVALSAVLWHFGSGLRPVPGLAFLAPLPVLLLAGRVSPAVAFVSGTVAWLTGELQMWTYLTNTLEQPAPFTVALLGGSAAVFGGLVTLTGILLTRGRPAAATLALPAGWTAFEFVVSLTSSTGAWWSIAYAQADVRPLIQSASLTGVWGITFLILLAPAAIAVLVHPAVTAAQRLRIASATAVVAVGVAAFGAWRLATEPQRETVRVGLVAVAQPPDFVPVDTPEGRDMVTRAVAEIDRLADQGARVVVLPEKSWRADESTLPLLADPLTEVAARRDIHVIAGLVLTRTGETINAAIDFPSRTVYAKHYLIPGLEDEFAAGTAYRQVPGEPWSLTVCFDLDHPALVRANRNLGSTMLLVPALDFTDDYWLHSRMAVLRGIESGLAIARAPQLGELVASDARGHILASARTDTSRTTTVLATIPQPSAPTLYARFGDWFGWIAIALFAITLIGAAWPHTRARGTEVPKDPIGKRISLAP
ncbi:apolipoprotein N-acyltransferase [Nocardia mexicana]|uniref:Apolipoprotein N-acyltransferase n=1 Tax=Nocardia mexicana TaxID=279262 RepID=A0A370H5Y8_9NOCA|nr:apolipoprotein N-acyltransferase [Nocardia mexicana]